MGRLQQNLMYAIILVVIFVICIYLFTFNRSYEVKGIYLPAYSTKLPPTNPNKMKVFNLRYQSDTEGNIGQIRTSIHVNNQKDFQSLCDENLHKAILLAADNGADEIKYVCLFPEGQINELSSVSLRAYAFRN
ncbi:hypothetical protein [Francisella sp. 19X1-34]|uniref:Francisella virulence factor A n=1 Tax=Francisella sp. 19X1-34 TaxID=3087177 RepID=UPI002E30ED86|nr:hypothetical protein [Francisella sp. 19X1-34]MED7789315.1 hypothetical protein [Francisella sp. 19X1-34]